MKHFLLAIAFILIILMITTYPLVFGMSKYIPGFFSTDESFSYLWEGWQIKNFSLANYYSKNNYSISYPFGVDLFASGYVTYLRIAVVYILSLTCNPIQIYNLQIVINFILTGAFTYLLVFLITKSKWSSLFSSIIFTFSPQHFARSWQHISLTYTQWLPLILLSLFLLFQYRKVRYKILFLASLLLLSGFDYSIAYLGTVILIVAFVYLLIKGGNNYRKGVHKDSLLPLRDAFFLFICAAVILLPQYLPIIKKMVTFSSLSPVSAHNPYHRPFEDLFYQSARPLSYLLPSLSHPIFGRYSELFIGTPLYGTSITEHTLYLGWTAIVFGIVGFLEWKKRRMTVSTSEREYNFYIVFFLWLTLIAWLFSQPPWWQIGGLKIYMPSFFMYKLLPMFRAYCRFGIVVMLAVAVLAGFGLNSVLVKFKSNWSKIAITTISYCLVLLEFWNWPPYKVIDVSHVPEAYYWLKSQPRDTVIAEYPLDANSPNEIYKFYQTIHEKKIINWTVPGTYANKIAKTITNLSDLKTANILKWMGVKYVVVHRDKYAGSGLIDMINELDTIPKNQGLRLIKTFAAQGCPRKDIICIQKTGPIDVYEVIASSKQPNNID